MKNTEELARQLLAAHPSSDAAFSALLLAQGGQKSGVGTNSSSTSPPSVHTLLISLLSNNKKSSLQDLLEFDFQSLSIAESAEEKLAKLNALLGLAIEQKLLETGNPLSLSIELVLFASLSASASSTSFSGLAHLETLSTRIRAMEGVSSIVEAWKDARIVNWRNVITLDHHERKVLPVADAKNILVTSALPYVNNVPHLGNIIGCVLSADVYARFSRLRGNNTLFICGTDEYGTATETKALQEKVSCQELCDKYHALHASTYSWFGIDFDHFGRTTTPQQTEITQAIYKSLEGNGHVFEDEVTQLYCQEHQAFLADRFVEGTCPLCGYEDARGDQCDKCGKLLNAIDLVDPHCKLDNAVPVVRNSRHLFLNLTEQQEVLEKWYKKASVDGFWSSNSEAITSSWLKEGLKPRCITRDLKWGTKVPRPGFEDKVFYVWFDAPIGYPSITANYTPDWEKWWKNPDNVNLYQFMGKDNVPFHTVIFPSTLLGTKEPWTLLHHLSTTEYLQYESGKFSKSRGVGVFGNNVMDSGIPVEVWRYYLLANRPENSDTQFTWKSFASANNSELLANLGNFINRIVKFTIAKYDGLVPTPSLEEPEHVLIKDANVILNSFNTALESVKIRLGIQIMMELSSRGNVYLQENKIDNSLFTNNRKRCDTVVSTALNLAYLLSSLVYPYMPSTSAGILRQLNAPQRKLNDSWDALDILPGHKIGAAEYLFKIIEEKKMEECQRLYSGQQAPGGAVPEVGKKKGKKGGAAAGGAASTTAKPVALDPSKFTPEMNALNEKITSQGLVVRELKTAKGDPAKIKEAVDMLLKLKKEFTVLTSSVIL